MRIAFLLGVVIASCRDAPPVIKDTIAPAPPSASSSPAASAESPPVFGPVAHVTQPPTLRYDAVVTLSGTFREHDDDCRDELTLDAPIHVVDEHGKPARDGRGLGDHPVIGDASRVCVWGWKSLALGKRIDPQLPSGGHVVFHGTLSTPITAAYPSAMMLFDAEVISALPPPTPAPPGTLPEGDSVVYVRKADATTRALDLDLVYLYWGDAAREAATARHQPVRPYFIVDDSPQLRTITLPATVRAEYEDDGWRDVPLATIANAPQHLFLVRVEKGAATSMHRIDLP